MLSPGYDYGYVCVEFSLLEDAIGCMEANQVALYFGQMMLEGYIFMYGEGGFQVIKLWKGARSSYLQHTTCQPKSDYEEKLEQRPGGSSGRINGRRVYFKIQSPFVVGLYFKDGRWGR